MDRDGTINVEKHYLHKIDDFEILYGTLDGLKLLQDAGYLLVIVTNQSGIARGYYTEDDLQKLHAWMSEELAKSGIVISRIYYCPHLPDARIEKYRKVCECRKPALGLFKRAIEELEVDIDRSFAIGDKIRDLSICEFTGCRGYLVGNNEKEETIEYIKSGNYRNMSYADSLLDAAKEISGVDK